MASRLNSRQLPPRSFLARLSQTTGLAFALITASAAGIHAEDVTVVGAPGENGAVNGYPGEWELGGTGGSATANANSADPLNKATAVGGIGGDGGYDPGGDGGGGGAAQATAATSIMSGSADAHSVAIGGSGGNAAFKLGIGSPYANGGSGGTATASATGSSGNGSANASASATGGSGTMGQGFGGWGGDASAGSTAKANGSGDASSSANATGGSGDWGIDGGGSGGNATATANASAAGGGKAIATAGATPGLNAGYFGQPGAQATSNAETANGAMAQALSTANPSAYSPYAFSIASSTAKTTFAGVTATAAATATYSYAYANPTYPAKTEAVAEGGSAQTSVDPDVYTAMSVASPDKAFATTLIGGESHVADAFLGPQDEIFGAAILVAGTSTFDFDYQGDLRLGVIDGGGDVTVNGAEVSIGDPGDDTVINLGFFGPNIDLTISGFGTFVIGRTVPEASTWAMMLLGFAGLGFVGYRQTRAARPQAT